MLKKILFVFIFFTTIFFSLPKNITAQETAPKTQLQHQEQYYKGQVISVKNVENTTGENVKNKYQIVEIKLDNGKTITIEHGKLFSLSPNQFVQAKTEVIILETKINNESSYLIIDIYRLDNVIRIILIFFVLVIYLSRLKGIGSIIGLIFSFVVIIKFIVPQIINGGDPMMISIVGASAILTVTIFLAHGFKIQTIIALTSTIITLMFASLLAILFVNLTKLTGLGSEEAYNLTFGQVTSGINFKGLLLGGMLLGAVGVLDDITTGQSAAIFELKKANPKYSFKQLFRSSLAIGQEHISSLVNTLVLAYAGASLPIFLLLVINPVNQPWWVIVNGEFISEEIIRTAVGSIALVLAVPLTSLLASLYKSRYPQS